jgi:hypothetical protein
MMTDLTLAFGNLFTENPASPVAPPGGAPETVRHVPSDFCTNPVVVNGLKNLEFTPDGTSDATTFFDGGPTLFFCRATMERVDFCSEPANVASPMPVAMEEPFANSTA